jgi:prevent-host-death family protein
MRTANIGTLRNQLSAYLKYVRNGEEVVICDRNVPVARILPFHPADWSDRQAALAAAGKIKLPVAEMDWPAFHARRRGSVPHDLAVQATVDSRGDR